MRMPPPLVAALNGYKHDEDDEAANYGEPRHHARHWCGGGCEVGASCAIGEGAEVRFKVTFVENEGLLPREVWGRNGRHCKSK